MIELPLDLINAQSPYEVSYAPNGDFVFATSLNILTQTSGVYS